jgi:hypothetical protein
MNLKNNTNVMRFVTIAGMIMAAIFSRFIPHPPNFTAVGAVALFGAAYFDKKIYAFVVPVIAMIISDGIIGFHPGVFAVYFSFIVIGAIGLTLRERRNIGRVVVASLSASVSFFIITNFAQWVSDPFYTKNTAGLIECYIMAIPFFHYTVLGDLFFVGVMFGAYEFAKSKISALSASPKEI